MKIIQGLAPQSLNRIINQNVKTIKYGTVSFSKEFPNWLSRQSRQGTFSQVVWPHMWHLSPQLIT